MSAGRLVPGERGDFASKAQNVLISCAHGTATQQKNSFAESTPRLDAFLRDDYECDPEKFD